VDVTSAVFVIAMSASIAPPPQLLVQPGAVTVTVTLEEVLVSVFVVLVDSPTMPVFVICVPTVSDASTNAAMFSVAVELGDMSPIVHVPVELAYEVPTEAVAFSNVSPEGKVSVATTPVEVAGPSASTVNV